MCIQPTAFARRLWLSLDTALDELQELYADAPVVRCFACGACCVSPHMSLVEFAHLLGHLLESKSREELRALAGRAPTPSEEFEGNLDCALKEGKLCGAREGRTLSCRLEGLAVLDGMFGRETPSCANADKKADAPDSTPGEIEEFLRRLNALNAEFYLPWTEPYHLDGLNFECWLAVCLDPGITQEFFLRLRGAVLSRFDLGFLVESYVNTTGLKQKLDLIDEVVRAVEQQRFKYAKKLLYRIAEGFPNTGSYYYFQAQFIEQELEGISTDED